MEQGSQGKNIHFDYQSSCKHSVDLQPEQQLPNRSLSSFQSLFDKKLKRAEKTE